MTDPKISIAMATYNGARFIREQLDSLAAQSLLPCELVVCDDGSADSTVEIVEGFAKTAPFPVRIYRNPQRLGYADNFLKAAKLCEGDWTAFCDQDDSWLPEKLEVVAAAIRRHPEVVLVTHPAELVDEALQPTGETAWPCRERISPRYSCLWHGGMGCGQIFRSFLIREIPFERRFIRDLMPRRVTPHDDWVARLSLCVGSAFFLSRPLVLRRRHAASVTWEVKPGTTMSLQWPKWHDVTESLAARAKLAEDQADVLAECALRAGPQFSATLNDASEYFAEAARILRARADCRRTKGPRRYSRSIELFADPLYWQMGKGIVGWGGRVRDLVDLFGYRVSPEVATRT